MIDSATVESAFPPRSVVGQNEKYQLGKRSGEHEPPIISSTGSEKKRLREEILTNPFSQEGQGAITTLSRESVTAYVPEITRMSELTSGVPSSYQFDLIRDVIQNDTSGMYERHFHEFTEADKTSLSSLREKQKKMLRDELLSSMDAIVSLRRFFTDHRDSLLGMIDEPESLYRELTQSAFGTTDIDSIGERFSIKQRVGLRLAIINGIQHLNDLKDIDASLQGMSLQEKVAQLFGVTLPAHSKAQLELTALGYSLTVPHDEYDLFTKKSTSEGIMNSVDNFSVYEGAVSYESSHTASIPFIVLDKDAPSFSLESTRRHEEEHVLQRLFADRLDETTIIDFGRKLPMQSNMLGHRHLAHIAFAGVMHNAYDEFGAYFTESKFDSSLTAALTYRSRDALSSNTQDSNDYLTHVLDFLNTSAMTVEEKQEILGIYLRAYQKSEGMIRTFPIVVDLFKEEFASLKRKNNKIPDDQSVDVHDELQALFLLSQPEKAQRIFEPINEEKLRGNMIQSLLPQTEGVFEELALLKGEGYRRALEEPRVARAVTNTVIMAMTPPEEAINTLVQAIHALRSPGIVLKLADGLSRAVQMQYATIIPGGEGYEDMSYSRDTPFSADTIASIKEALEFIVQRDEKDFVYRDQNSNAIRSIVSAKKTAQDALTRMKRIEAILYPAA